SHLGQDRGHHPDLVDGNLRLPRAFAERTVNRLVPLTNIAPGSFRLSDLLKSLRTRIDKPELRMPKARYARSCRPKLFDDLCRHACPRPSRLLGARVAFGYEPACVFRSQGVLSDREDCGCQSWDHLRIARHAVARRDCAGLVKGVVKN